VTTNTPLAEAPGRPLGTSPSRLRRVEAHRDALPRLQTIGDESVTFLYAINWTQSVRQPDVGRYQRGEGGPFDTASTCGRVWGRRSSR